MNDKRLYIVQGRRGKYRYGRQVWMTKSDVQRYKEWGYDVRGAVGNYSYQASLQARQSSQSSQSVYARPSNDYVGVNHNRYWGKNTFELRESARKTGNPVISWDDILDVQLALKKGI